MKRYLLVLGIFAVLLAAGCSSGVKESANAGTSSRVPAGSGDEATVGEAVVVQESYAKTAPEINSVRQFTMTAKQWEFSPDTITVNKGDTVVLSVRSIDVAHGFALPEFGVNEQLEPGKVVEVEFVADKTGTFSFFCSIVCGAGHGDMKGTLVVE